MQPPRCIAKVLKAYLAYFVLNKGFKIILDKDFYVNLTVTSSLKQQNF